MIWDQPEKRFYETGVDRVVLYRNRTNGVPWNGVSSITDSSEGGEASAVYADDMKYLTLMSEEDVKLTIEAFQYPDEFRQCMGQFEVVPGAFIGQQTRHHFGLCYRTLVGNASDGNSYGYKIHLVYDCLAAPHEHAHNTTNDSPEAESLSWDVSTTKVLIDGYKPSASLVIDSRYFTDNGLDFVLEALEKALYGSDDTVAKLLLPSEAVSLVKTTVGKYVLLDGGGDWILDGGGGLPVITSA